MPDVLLAQVSITPLQVGNDFCVCIILVMNGKRTEIYSAYLTLSLAFFLLRNRMREEVPSSATGFLHALEQRFCLLCLSDTGQLSP